MRWRQRQTPAPLGPGSAAMAALAADSFRGLRGPPSGSRPPHRLVSPQNRLLVLLAPGKGPEGRLVAAEAGRKAGEVSHTRWGRQRMENKSVVHPHLGLSSPALPDPKADDWVTTMKIYSERSGFPVPTIPLISWSLSEQAALTFCVPSCSSACRGSA